MVTGTFLAVFFIPLFYFLIYRLMEKARSGQNTAARPVETGSPEGR
jgi:preprotein translocase subunit YajC